MNKKGMEHQFFFGMEVIIGILVAGILISTAANVDSLSNVNKIYAKEDMKLLVETIQSSPGSIEYNYKIKSMYNVDITKEDITITQTEIFFDGYSYYNLILNKEQDSKQIMVKKNA